MAKQTNRWVLYTYLESQLTLLSPPFKTKAHAEKARQKYPDKERKAIGVGVVRFALKAKV
jgi:hypothetical protein